MSAADAIVWLVGDEWGLVPMQGLAEMPIHLREQVSRWLRRQAVPRPHALALVTTGVFFRVVGRQDACCPTCAIDRRLAEWVLTCARCGREVDDHGYRTAFSLAGHALIFGAWCVKCSTKEEK